MDAHPNHAIATAGACVSDVIYLPHHPPALQELVNVFDSGWVYSSKNRLFELGPTALIYGPAPTGP